jgi:large subunit ribosomal protein L19
MGLLEKIENTQIKTDRPDLRPGYTVEVMVRVIEGDKERQQKFRGLVTNVRGAGMRKTFTVRKISEGVGVERTFPLNSPTLASITVIPAEEKKVRRAKLFDLRKKKGKSARLKDSFEQRLGRVTTARWRRLASEEARIAGPRATVAGVDEAGRGPLAGPVVAAAVVLDLSRDWDGLNDSKQLTAEKRDAQFARVLQGARAFAWSVVGPRTHRPRQHPHRDAHGDGARGRTARAHARTRAGRWPRDRRGHDVRAAGGHRRRR